MNKSEVKHPASLCVRIWWKQTFRAHKYLFVYEGGAELGVWIQRAWSWNPKPWRRYQPRRKAGENPLLHRWMGRGEEQCVCGSGSKGLSQPFMLFCLRISMLFRKNHIWWGPLKYLLLHWGESQEFSILPFWAHGTSNEGVGTPTSKVL